MNRCALVLFTLVLLTGGCVTTPPPTAFEAWQSRLTEGQSLAFQAAVIAAEVYNETYDHTIKELKEDRSLAERLRDKINAARRLYRRAQSWNLSEMPPAPEKPTSSFANQWVLTKPDLPVNIVYIHSGSSCDRVFYSLKVRTLRGKDVLCWTNIAGPEWPKPFYSFVVGDRVDLDVEDLILLIKLNATPNSINLDRE